MSIHKCPHSEKWCKCQGTGCEKLYFEEPKIDKVEKPDFEKINVTSQEQFESVYKVEYGILKKHLKLFWIDSVRACEAMREYNRPLQKELSSLKAFEKEIVPMYEDLCKERDALKEENERAKELLRLALNAIDNIYEYQIRGEIKSFLKNND